MKVSEWTDAQGDRLRVSWWSDGEPVVRVNDTNMCLHREAVLELHALLGAYLQETRTDLRESLPDATADGYDWPQSLCGDSIGPVPKLGGEVFTCNLAPGHAAEHQEGATTWSDRPEQSGVAAEAHAMVYGDRQDDYGHPREDFTRTAVVWSGLLQHKLADGAYIEPEDIASLITGAPAAAFLCKSRLSARAIREILGVDAP